MATKQKAQAEQTIGGIRPVANVVAIPLRNLKPGTNYSRHFPMTDDQKRQAVDNFRRAIKEGTITPISVSAPDSKGMYTVIAGFQRFDAATTLGVESIPAKLTGFAPGSMEARKENLSENAHRADMSVVDKSMAARDLAKETGVAKWWTNKPILAAVSMPPDTASFMARVLDKLSDKQLRNLHEGVLGIEGARTLLGVSQELQDKLVELGAIERAEEEEQARQERESKPVRKQRKEAKPRKVSSKVQPKHLAKAAGKLVNEDKAKGKKANPELTRITNDVRRSIKQDKKKQKAAQEAAPVVSAADKAKLDDLYTMVDGWCSSDNEYVAGTGDLLVKFIEGKLTAADTTEAFTSLMSETE